MEIAVGKQEEGGSMKRSLSIFLAVSIVSGLYFSLSLAHENHQKHLPDQKDPIAFRTYLMDNIGDNAKELNDKIKAGKPATLKVNAQAIALLATRIPELFPKGSLSAQSRAKEDIWQNWDQFVKSAEELKIQADELAVVSQDGKADTVGPQLKKVMAACKSCHDSFRQPEKKEQGP
jgi:cytochrome c556